MPPILAVAPVDSNTLKVLSDAGPFALGSTFGGILSYFLFKLASDERKDRVKHEMEREKELLKQLDTKDKRIDELHKELAMLKPKSQK
ncbi:MAG: hypothetical protein H7A55_04360 [Verrucomicrobiaceae bacterium]|nr:hypothetical protein [Verrucomicrobiaceae bacterium]